MRLILSCLAVCVFGVVLASCSSTGSRRAAKPAEKERNIRVLLAEGSDAHTVAVSRGALVRTPEGIRVLSADGRADIVVAGTRPSINVEVTNGGGVAVAFCPRAHQHGALHFVRMSQGEFLGDDATHGDADYAGFFDAFSAAGNTEHQIGNVIDSGLV